MHIPLYCMFNETYCLLSTKNHVVHVLDLVYECFAFLYFSLTNDVLILELFDIYVVILFLHVPLF